MDQSQEPELDKTADRYALILSRPSALFSSTVRSIKSAEANHATDGILPKELATNISYFLFNISPTLKCTLYKTAQEIHPEELSQLSKLNLKSLLNLFSASEQTAILTISFYFRHLKRKLDEGEFSRLSKRLLTHMQLGSIIGETIKYIGIGNGMLIGALAYLSHGVFALADLKNYQEFRRKIEKDKKLFSSQIERQYFNCTKDDLSAVLARNIGFGLSASLGIAKKDPASSPDSKTVEEILCWKMAASMIESFHETNALSTQNESGEGYLPPEEVESLQQSCFAVLRDGASMTWPLADRSQLSDEVKQALNITAKVDQSSGIDETFEGEESQT
jgi:hypothetical protein